MSWNAEKESYLESRVFTVITAIVLVVLILSFSYFTRPTPMNTTTSTTTTTHPIGTSPIEIENERE
jgi:succinate dehydrogenase hydrophobic anchor subunit